MKNNKILFTHILLSLIFFFSLFGFFSQVAFAQGYPPVKIAPAPSQFSQSQMQIVPWVFIVLFFVVLILLFISIFRTPRAFSKYDALKIAWHLTREHLFFFFIPLVILQYLVAALPDFITIFLTLQLKVQGLSTSVDIYHLKSVTAYSGIMFVIKLALSFLVTMGLIKISFDMLDTKKGDFKQLFSQYRLIPYFFVGWLIYSLVTSIGLALLVIPGIMLGILFLFWPYLMLDKGYKPIQALKASFQLTKGAGWDLFFFIVLLGAINVLGALCLIVGLFITLPLTLLALAHVYRQLAQK